MDAVITYVDGLDPQWQAQYASAVGKSILAKRYRDWGTLKYLLRGIQQYLPFVENVYLVVALESQVPEWVDRKNLRIVLHKDIIPEELLPVFNSASIELFLHRIQGLSEQFIYFNDDCFPVSMCQTEDFFCNGKVMTKYARHIFAQGLFKKQTKSSDRLARKAAGKGHCLTFVRPQHISTLLLRSQCEELFNKYEDTLRANVSKLREPYNCNFYLYSDYLLFKGLVKERRLSNRHFSLALASASKIASFLQHPDTKFMCVNDVEMPEQKYEQTRKILLDAFDKALPVKSRFELA